MRRPCLEPGCRNTTERTRCADCERARQARRNRDPKRHSLYDAAWDRHSRERRAEHPYCSVCGTSTALTVDHQSDAVLCRRHHGALEAQRRAAKLEARREP